ncbi:MAG: PocR ligand-binding domain-containing protein [Eubacteriales bacterium]|nr:PocR ligand-binding domain-containing protein [Eubacteriales bacterium]
MLRINRNVLYKALKDFYTLTHIRIVLIDSNFNEIISFPNEYSYFCGTVRKNLQINTECVKCDREVCQKCAKTKDLILYSCHLGLAEAVVPIYDHNGVMGYAMFGQVFRRGNHQEVKERLRSSFNNDMFENIDQVLEEIPVKSDAELNAAGTVLQALVTYFLSNQWVLPEKAEFIRRLDKYIEEHIRESITVEDICGEFHAGRTRTYELAEEYLGCGIAEYVRMQRIAYAQRLLRETETSINDISYMTGFSDYAHFFRVFKNVVGISAKEYRKLSYDTIKNKLSAANKESEEKEEVSDI